LGASLPALLHPEVLALKTVQVCLLIAEGFNPMTRHRQQSLQTWINASSTLDLMNQLLCRMEGGIDKLQLVG
jgi:hypothetical protein